MPIFLECQRCTACCRWPGQVQVTDLELARLAKFKGLGKHEFIQKFMRLRPNREWPARGAPRNDDHFAKVSQVRPVFS
jgi:hypothetical protein